MFSKKMFFLLVGIILLIPAMTFSQRYVSDKCNVQKHSSWELTVTSSHSYFNYNIHGKYSRSQQGLGFYDGKHPHFSYIGMPILRDGDGEIWIFDSELLIPVNWGVMSHIVTGLKYSTMNTDFLYSNHSLNQEGIMVTVGFKLRF